MERSKETVVRQLRACLVSNKQKMPLRMLDDDYKTVVGERIPYSILGFRNLEEFIRSDPTLTLTVSNGEKLVSALIIEESAHISKMVAAQKTGKRTKNKFSYQGRPATTSRWRPKHAGQNNKKYHTSSRPAAVSHNQFVNVGREQKAVHSQSYRTVHRQNSQLSSRLQVAEPISDRRVFTNEHSSKVQVNSLSNNRKEEEVSKISSCRQRISKKMSEMSLDRDSGNSSPTADLPLAGGLPQMQPIFQQPLPQGPSTQQPFSSIFPSQTSVYQPRLNTVPELVLTGEPISDLKRFAKYHNLGEVDVSVKQVKTKMNRLYTCLIKVANESFTSYPKEFSTPLEAEVQCSKEALEHLSSKLKKKKPLLLANDRDILERIPPLLEKHPYGIWASQLELVYTDKYNEQLPYDWLKVIDSSPCIQIQKSSEKYILNHCEPGEKEQQRKLLANLADVSVPANTVSFVEDGKLFAEVTCVIAANEIWCRQCGTEECTKFNQMEADMEKFYTNHKDNHRVDEVTPERYYVTQIENFWYRIRAITNVEGEVSCFLIDYGDEMIVPIDKVYELRKEFALSQAQAFVCRLFGLEDLYEISASSVVLQQILYTFVTLELASDNVVKNDIIPVYMYDLETGTSVNEDMIHRIAIESALPVLQNGMITEVFVSNIENDGDIYVQLRSPGYFSLQTLLEDLEKQITSDPPTHLIRPVTKRDSEGKFYFGKNKFDGRWHRIELIDWAPNEELAQIHFIDYGHTDVINVKDEILYPLETLSDILSQYPPQAVRVKMAMDSDIPENFVSLAKKAMPENNPVLLKIIREDENERFAEFFKRNTDGGLFCINKSITMEVEMKKEDIKSKTLRRNPLHWEGANKNVPSGGKLKSPKIPEKQEYFEVHVSLAVSPYNFFVQPLESQSKLHQLMEQLQERYKEVLYSPLSTDQIIPGNIYASKFDDGNWYRTSVIKVIHSGSISVFYCDFGYYGNLNVQQLIPLDVEFMQLPYQALKAKLHSVKPKESKWTMEDCNYFKEMVEKKSFYSIIIDIEKDELYESDLVLQLVLIDTSTSEDDIYIGTELIKKGIAVEVKN
ncbi:tudor domain-containing protein 7 tapas isoform X2 [Leptinotarsa decemlineata]|uniref:tudor domain-containing protein 7 tapas isoform X2 n=1 Tax=Leptinotarsa decemlineata TaxID=7539 RepID=UPI003D30540E